LTAPNSPASARWVFSVQRNSAVRKNNNNVLARCGTLRPATGVALG